MLQVFQFKNLSSIPWACHAVSTRYENLNLSWLTGDDKKTVLENRKKFFGAVGTKEEDVVEMNQIHGNHVALVGEKEKDSFILKTDAIITNTPGVALFVKVADCVPILLADSKKRAVAVVHAGWRGTALEIAKLAVEHLEDHFGTNPADILAGIGPSIGPCCYEVDTPVIAAFSRLPYVKKIFTKKNSGHTHLDLWKANKFQLIETGVKEKNIEVAVICTADNTDEFFSERKEGKTGRFGAVVWIEK